MKPHIFFRYGRWRCEDRDMVTSGKTPMAAYAYFRMWKEFDRLKREC